MPAQSNIPVADSASATRTFTAAGVKNGVALWLEKTASTITGFFRLTYSMRLPTKAAEPVRHQLKLVMPTVVTETINGVNYQKVVRQCMADLTVVIAPDATLTERKDVMEFVSRMCQSGLAESTKNFYNQVINNDETT